MVNWTFLRLILLKVGLAVDTINWLIGCVTSTNFSVLINGLSSSFFNVSQILIQGCPLSPLLFLLVVEGLGRLIGEAKRKGKTKGIKLSSTLAITHLLFVDNVVLFGTRSLEE